MVKKLIKYDFKSYYRLLLPVQLIVIGFGLVNRIIQFFEPPVINGSSSVGVFSFLLYGRWGSSTVYNLTFNSSLILYFTAIAVCLLMTAVVSIVRFYQGLYTNEGYLSHTLPVTSKQHITAKLLTFMLFMLGSLLSVFLSFIVITAGELNIEIFKAVFYIIGILFDSYGANTAFYIFEAVILFILICCHTFVKLYCCVSIGQLASKKKILLAFGVYFAVYIIKQIIGTVFIIIFSLNSSFIVDNVRKFAETNPTAVIHIVFCAGIVYYFVINSVYFIFSNYIMSKKLNLT